MSKKEAILQAATILFSTKGFKDTSMNELCKMTGVAEGTIFYHFKNKQDLFLAVLEAIKWEIIEEFENYLEKFASRVSVFAALSQYCLRIPFYGSEGSS